jgi:hypothetical protein
MGTDQRWIAAIPSAYRDWPIYDLRESCTGAQIKQLTTYATVGLGVAEWATSGPDFEGFVALPYSNPSGASEHVIALRMQVGGMTAHWFVSDADASGQPAYVTSMFTRPPPDFRLEVGVWYGNRDVILPKLYGDPHIPSAEAIDINALGRVLNCAAVSVAYLIATRPDDITSISGRPCKIEFGTELLRAAMAWPNSPPQPKPSRIRVRHPEQDKAARELRANIRAARKELGNTQTTDPSGYVYVMSNPVWQDMIKIGKCQLPEERLSGYQTSDPHRAFMMHHTAAVSDRRLVEKAVHLHFADECFGGEWFRLSPDTAWNGVQQVIAVIDKMKQEH